MAGGQLAALHAARVHVRGTPLGGERNRGLLCISLCGRGRTAVQLLCEGVPSNCVQFYCWRERMPALSEVQLLPQ